MSSCFGEASAAHWSVGHGQLFMTGALADYAIDQIDAAIEEVPPGDVGAILKLLRMKLGFVRQSFETGKAHLKYAEKPGTNLPP